MNPRARLLIPALLAFLLFGAGTHAQWVTQQFDLKAGYNAVFLHVDPSHEPIAASAGSTADIEEIWLWQAPASLRQFIQVPQGTNSNSSQWRVWRRSDAANASLATLVPNAAYLVRLRSDLPAKTWELKGKAVAPRYEWTSSGLNFVGFPAASGPAPTFEQYLAQAPADFQHTAELFLYPGGDLGPGNPKRLLTPRTTPVKRGDAFWLHAGENVYNRYYGPFEVVRGGADLVDFGDQNSVASFRLKNLSPRLLTVTLNLADSEDPPTGKPAIQGVPPLLVRGDVSPVNLTYSHTLLSTNAPRSWTLAPAGQPGSETEVVLGLNRTALTGTNGTLYAGILRFTDDLGLSRVEIGTSATVASSGGLWVGQATVDQVGQYLKQYPKLKDASPSEVATQIAALGLPAQGMPLPSTWVERETQANRAYSAIACSLDGRRAVTADDGIPGNLYVTQDYGANWVARETSVSRKYRAVACSANGSVMVAAPLRESLLVSTDAGTTWTPRGPVALWSGVSCSEDGSRMAAVTRNGIIHLSSDAGLSWSESMPPILTTTAWTNDASAGVSDSRTLWAAAFGTATSPTINNVTFTGYSGPSVSTPRFELQGPVAAFNADSNNLNTGPGIGGTGSSQLSSNFVYGGNPTTVTLKDLTPGTDYVLSLFSVGFEVPGGRIQVPSIDGASWVVDQDQFGNNAGIRVDLAFRASSPAKTLTITPQNPGVSLHLYGMALSLSHVWSASPWTGDDTTGIDASRTLWAAALGRACPRIMGFGI